MTTSTVPRALNPFITARQQERDARQELILDFMQTVEEPVIPAEVAHAFDISESTARHDMNALVDERKLFSRLETAEERTIRFGSTAFARPAHLFWKTSNVPPRTKRVVVSGYEVSPSVRPTPMPGDVIDSRVARQIERLGVRSRFTIKDISKRAGTPYESTRKRIQFLEDAKLVKQDGTKGGARVYQLLSKVDAVNILGGIQDKLPQPAKTARQTIEDVLAAEKPAPVTTSVDGKIRAVLEENAKLRTENANLKRQLEEARSQVPAVDPALLADLDSWTPVA